MYTAITLTLLKQRTLLFEYLEILNTSFGSDSVGPSNTLQRYDDLPDNQDSNDASTSVIDSFSHQDHHLNFS
jgi:hypothetical protein